MRSLTWGQAFAWIFGMSYLVSGLLALIYSDGLTGGSPDDKLLIFRTNIIHALVHVGLGVGWLVAARSASLARVVNKAFGFGLLVVAIVGFTGVDLMHSALNIGGSGDSDNFLHLANAVAAIYVGWWEPSRVAIPST